MRDIIVTIKHRPVPLDNPSPVLKNQLSWTVDTNRYELVIGEPEVTEYSIARGVHEILKVENVKEKSRQHGNADSFEEKG